MKVQANFPQLFAKKPKNAPTTPMGDDIPWRNSHYQTIIRVQSVLGAVDVWRTAMQWPVEVSGGTESRTGYCPQEKQSFLRGCRVHQLKDASTAN